MMAHSLAEECTPLKHAYDSCFNAWFEGYLQPAVSAASEQRAEYTKAKADEFEEKCGKIWEGYRACVQKAVKDKGLDEMLAEATKDNPLDTPPPDSDS
ncbi:mitochondrial distribution/morphology family 35/apoptosis [Phellopilus nigrolimitatus]|nr:mitochondrial distribution/morphology family 35/apoptosis [Phellopilus nigrolimitatus]